MASTSNQQKKWFNAKRILQRTAANVIYFCGNKNKKQEEIQGNDFIPIAIKKSSKPKNVKLKIIFPNGVKYFLPEDLEIDKIKKFIEVLNAC